jgi:hypothetical protein
LYQGLVRLLQKELALFLQHIYWHIICNIVVISVTWESLV